MIKRLFFLAFLLLGALSQKNDYVLKDFSYTDDKQNHLTGTIEYTGEAFNPEDYTDIAFQEPTSPDLVPIKSLGLDVSVECNSILHVRITDKANDRWEPIETISDDYKAKIQTCENTKSLKDLGFSFTEDKTSPFTFSMTADNEVYFNSAETNFLFTDKFIAFGGYLTSDDVYGFGERYHKLKLGEGIFTLWPNDTCGIHEDKGDGGYNAMGTHPMALHKTSSGKFLGLLFNNINAQDVMIKKYEEKKFLLEHRTIGGIIDYYFYLGSSVDDTLIKLHDVIGQPMLPPFWSLGFHQCRWGYHNTSEIETVMKKFLDYEIPVDTLWGDIDILDEKRIFTLNTKDFNDLPLLIYEMHKKDLHFVPIVDLGFPKKDSDPFYAKGKETNAFIMSNYTKDFMVSYVWPGNAVFPDFFTKSGTDLWEYAMEEYYKIIKYDGIWIDMNEPAMINAMKNNLGEVVKDKDVSDEKNIYAHIPYIPGYNQERERINIVSHTMSENAYSHETESKPLLTSYNFKPLLALLQAKNTREYLIKLNKRPFILSRSTMLGAGKYTFHWLGDNQSTFADMRNGVNGIYQFQIYGIPMVGDDICGFNDDSNDQLCARWMMLGALFPFSRNHNSEGKKSQEPFAFGPKSYTFYNSYVGLRLRYQLLRYYYTQLFLISKGKSGSFFKPAFFEFPSDPLAYENVDNGIMIGNALYYIPNFSTETSIDAYFPNADWTTVNGNAIIKTFDPSKTEGTVEKMDYKITDIKLYYRGGSILPIQNSIYPYVRNTKGLRSTPLELAVLPDSVNHAAEGEVIYDDDAVDTLATNNYLHIKMKFNTDTLLFSKENDFKKHYEYTDTLLSQIAFMRMTYLDLGENAIIVITDINDNVYNSKLYHVDHLYYANTKELKLTIDMISSIKIQKVESHNGFLSLLE